MATRYDDTIRQGETFYAEVELISRRFSVAELRAMTPRATLLDTDISIPCAWIGDGTKATLAMSISQAVTATLSTDRAYEHNMDLNDGTNIQDALYGVFTIRKGQKPL
jgi:hypothetical protein